MKGKLSFHLHAIIAMKYFFLLAFFMVFSTLNGQIKRPNILIILTDDLGKGDMGFSGGKIKTPFLDNMAARGMILNKFYANSTVCSPSRASLLSGKYPDLAGVPGVIRQQLTDSWGYLDPGIQLLPAYLKKAGYHTAMVGKWHLGLEKPNLPRQKGFDEFKGFLGDMMDDYYTHRRQGVNWMRHNEEEIDPKGHATEIFTNWTIDYLNDRVNKKEPFFLFLSYNAPHFPIQPPMPNLESVRQRFQGMSGDRQRNIALVEHLDEQIGYVFRQLEENKQLQHTLIFFVSDNGGSLPHAQSNGDLRGGKQDFYEGGIQVPAFVYWDRQIPAGKVSQDLMLHMDILPTLLDIAGTEKPAEIDGISMWDSWRRASDTTRERTLFWVRREGGTYNGLAYYAARKNEHKIFQNHPQESFQYVNLEMDPLEKNPVPAINVTEGKQLLKTLMEHIRKTGAIPWQKPGMAP